MLGPLDPEAAEGPTVHPHPDDTGDALTAGGPTRRQLEAYRARCARSAKTLFAAGAAGVLFICVAGMKPAPIGIPVLLGAISLLFAAASAALFARIAHLYLQRVDRDGDDDDRGPGGGYDEPPEPPGGSDLGIDWQQFERDFRAYCERAVAAR